MESSDIGGKGGSLPPVSETPNLTSNSTAQWVGTDIGEDAAGEDDEEEEEEEEESDDVSGPKDPLTYWTGSPWMYINPLCSIYSMKPMFRILKSSCKMLLHLAQSTFVLRAPTRLALFHRGPFRMSLLLELLLNVSHLLMFLTIANVNRSM